MADPLLNTLCTICHINAPKYVCPGCSAQTCSLPCTKRHKSWANCSGRRDPAAFMPASRLKTPAGIDHDYNFLSAIERERARNQRDLVEDRKLFTERDVRAMEDDSRFRKHWLGDSVRFDPVRGGPRTFGEDGGDEDDVDNEDNGNHTGGGGGGGDGPEGGSNVPARASYLTRQVRQRLDSACIQVVQMPVGMSRQRENTTSWNRKSRSINWCVEWMVYDGGCEAALTRIRHKALESVPLYKALGNSMAWYRKGQQHKGEPDDENEDKDDEEEPAYARKRRRVLIREVREDEGRRTAMQDGASATWATETPYPSQNPYTGTWGLDRGPSATSWLPDGEVEARRGYRFYLLKPLTPAGKPRELIPVAAAETLSSALQGRTVLEYPTFYVLPPPDSPSSSTPTPVLPEGYILGPTERRERPRRNNNNNNNNKSAKRKATDSNNNKKNDKSQPPAKRQAMTAGGDDGGDGIPIRGPNNNQRGARGGARGGRGGGRLQQQQQQQQQARGGGGGGGAKRPAQDAEEGEINSDGDEVPRQSAAAAAGRRRPDRAAAAADPADTSSSDPDTSSDEEEGGEEEEEEGEQGLTLKLSARGGHDAMHVDDDDDDDDGDHDGPPQETRPTAAAAGKRKSSGLGLVEYGSDSDGSDEDGDEDDEDVDLAGLKPENPELVASAIKEIVGLLT